MQKNSFAQQLRELVRKSGIRQNEIAAKLGVTAAAVSQFLHGQTLPTPAHLDELLAIVSPSAETSRRLRELWMLCRALPAAEGESELNHNLFLLRSRKVFSLGQTARESGISRKRMPRLETDPQVKMTGREQKVFSLFFGCSPADSFSFSHDFSEDFPADDAFATVAESAGNMIPVLALSALKEYDSSCSLLEFALMKRQGFLPGGRSFCLEPVLILTDSEEIRFPHRGMIRIILSQRRPSGFLPLDLCCYPGGIFRLRPGEKCPAGEELPVSRDAGELPEPVWKLPVAEVTLRPLTME